MLNNEADLAFNLNNPRRRPPTQTSKTRGTANKGGDNQTGSRSGKTSEGKEFIGSDCNSDMSNLTDSERDVHRSYEQNSKRKKKSEKTKVTEPGRLSQVPDRLPSIMNGTQNKRKKRSGSKKYKLTDKDKDQEDN
jgi:hypothetical protein